MTIKGLSGKDFKKENTHDTDAAVCLLCAGGPFGPVRKEPVHEELKSRHPPKCLFQAASRLAELKTPLRAATDERSPCEFE